MSDLVYQNYNNRCQGWINPENLLFGPQITSLSSYQSPAGSSTLVSINGTNFYSYSQISFGTFKPTVYFINSNVLQFYVPSTLNYGTFPVQVFNGSVASNSVNYTIDNASGYWLLGSNNSIANTNGNGVGITWLSRGIPITIDNSYSNPYTIQNNNNWIICDVTDNSVYVNLPTGIDTMGREIMFKKIGGNINPIGGNINQILNISNNIQSIDGTTISNKILNTNTYNWTTLVYDGTYWVTMQCG